MERSGTSGAGERGPTPPRDRAAAWYALWAWLLALDEADEADEVDGVDGVAARETGEAGARAWRG